MFGRFSRLSHVQIRDGLASWQHLLLKRVNATIWVEDLSSTRDTLVQGQLGTPLQPVILGEDSAGQIADLPHLDSGLRPHISDAKQAL